MTTLPIPKRMGVKMVIGRIPLDLSDFAEGSDGGFAFYAEGLTSEEAGALTRLMWAEDEPEAEPEKGP